MLAGDALEEDDTRLLAKAVVAGLAALCAAALAVGLLDAVPAARPRGQAVPVAAPAAGPAVAGGGRGPAGAAPVPRMRFHGPGGELFDFTPAEHRFPAGADAGHRRGASQ